MCSQLTNPKFSSDGAGRSGVYIAIDANIELCEEDGVFDVYGYLKKMRGLRRGLVETLVSLNRSFNWGGWAHTNLHNSKKENIILYQVTIPVIPNIKEKRLE